MPSVFCSTAPRHYEGNLHVDDYLTFLLGGDSDAKSTCDFQLIMAHSRSNRLTTQIKELVSKNRNRYRRDGFNLDLTYITSNIIAMGFPASKIEGCYRNHIDDVFKMLEHNHRDHYKIYNLCSERSYAPEKFHNRVKEFPFDDHNPPKLELIRPFCEDVQDWLKQHDMNIAAVHCKAGKGRTGTMICCYLLHSKFFKDPDDALRFYGKTRTQDQKGVTIPSQVRYVTYYSRIIQENLVYGNVPLYLTEIKLEPPPTFGNKQVDLYFSIYSNGNQVAPMQVYKSAASEMQRNEHCYNVRLNVELREDIKIELHSKSKISKKAKLFQFWFNTFFVNETSSTTTAAAAAMLLAGSGSSSGCSSERTHMFGEGTSSQLQMNDANGFINNSGQLLHNGPLILCLRKSELDIINKKDKQNKTFSADFKITLCFLRQSPNAMSEWRLPPVQQPQEQRSSGSSEASESDSSDVWDSAVECDVTMDPRGIGYTRLLSDCDISTKLNDQHAAELLAI